jgi:hypothetical protein
VISINRRGIARLACVLAMAAGLSPRIAAESPLPAADAGDGKALAALADVSAQWGKGPEAVIESAYRECFRTEVVGGNIVTLRLPFAENSERSELAGMDLRVSGGGKADPAELWSAIDGLLASAQFASYLEALSDGKEKLIVFDMAARSWSASLDRFAIERTLAGGYTGLPHQPVVLSAGRGAAPEDIYNYIYCVGGIGIDCSGFVWHVLRALGKAGKLDLDREAGRSVGLPRGVRPALFVGTGFYDPRKGRTRQVQDRLDLLLPGDIILFRGEDGSFIHSCVIQSIDLKAGKLRYLQSTDESPLSERGVHESVVLFDPDKKGQSLKDPELRWLQLRGATFAGEPPSPFADDGERYRAYPEAGGGIVVRYKALEKAVAKLMKASPFQAAPAAPPR